MAFHVESVYSFSDSPQSGRDRSDRDSRQRSSVCGYDSEGRSSRKSPPQGKSPLTEKEANDAENWRRGSDLWLSWLGKTVIMQASRNGVIHSIVIHSIVRLSDSNL